MRGGKLQVIASELKALVKVKNPNSIGDPNEIDIEEEDEGVGADRRSRSTRPQHRDEVRPHSKGGKGGDWGNDRRDFHDYRRDERDWGKGGWGKGDWGNQMARREGWDRRRDRSPGRGNARRDRDRGDGRNGSKAGAGSTATYADY